MNHSVDGFGDLTRSEIWSRARRCLCSFSLRRGTRRHIPVRAAALLVIIGLLLPSRGAADLEQKQNQLLRLRGRLKDAVAGEDYELAARIRDEIRELERS